MKYLVTTESWNMLNCLYHYCYTPAIGLQYLNMYIINLSSSRFGPHITRSELQFHFNHIDRDNVNHKQAFCF